MSARVKRSVTRRRHREVQSSGLLLTWDGEEGGKRRREGGRKSCRTGWSHRDLAGGGKGSHPSLHMSCFIPGVPPNIFQRVPHVFHNHHILSRSPSHLISALLLFVVSNLVRQIWIYLTYPSGKEPAGRVWKQEAKPASYFSQVATAKRLPVGAKGDISHVLTPRG